MNLAVSKSRIFFIGRIFSDLHKEWVLQLLATLGKYFESFALLSSKEARYELKVAP